MTRSQPYFIEALLQQLAILEATVDDVIVVVYSVIVVVDIVLEHFSSQNIINPIRFIQIFFAVK